MPLNMGNIPSPQQGSYLFPTVEIRFEFFNLHIYFPLFICYPNNHMFHTVLIFDFRSYSDCTVPYFLYHKFRIVISTVIPWKPSSPGADFFNFQCSKVIPEKNTHHAVTLNIYCASNDGWQACLKAQHRFNCIVHANLPIQSYSNQA